MDTAALIGLGQFTLAALVWFGIGPKHLTNWLASREKVVLVLLVGALAFSGHTFYRTLHWSEETPRGTGIKLHFGVPGSLPESLEERNIWRYYALTNAFTVLDEGRVPRTVTTTTVVPVFNKPVYVKEFRIGAVGGAKLPTNEVKQQSDRHAILWFDRGLENLVLNVECIV